jgi:hypothetical protein
MEVADFEQDILKLAFETDVRITTASVAYYLGIPSTKAEPMLEELLERGVLELDSDREGNLYYRVAEVARGDSDQISQLRQERVTGVDGAASMESPGESDETEGGSPSPWDADTLGDATVDDVDSREPLSPEPARGRDGGQGGESDAPKLGSKSAEGAAEGSVGHRPVVDPGDSRPADGESKRHETYPSDRQREAARRDDPPTSRRNTGSRGDTPDHPGVVSTSDQVVAGVTREREAMDASLDNCGDDRVVVQSEVQCEPRPLADSDPVFTSCAERPESNTDNGAGTKSTGLIERREDYSAVGKVREPQPARAGSGSAAASLTYRQEHQLEQPEHQPGMSLLLSLILCGTGQIYNGEVSKGIMMMVLCFLLWFVLLGWVVHIWSIVDSVVVAERINRQSGNN